MNKKTKLAILGVIGLVLVTLSLTYAYWLITRTQTKENTITAGCLDISLSSEQNDIKLTEQFPISDDEGKELTPYTFTVTNNCNNPVDYNVNLEVLGDKESNIDSSSIKVMLDDGTPVLVGDKLDVEATNADAYEAHLLTQGTLAANGTATHSVRLWIDEDAPISEMNKSFSSKVSVTAGQGIINPIKEGTLAYNLVSQYDGTESITALDSTWVEGEFGAEEVYGFPSSFKAYYGTDYTFDPETGYFVLAGTLVQGTVAECRTGTISCGKYTLQSNGSTSKSRNLYEVASFTSDTADTDTKSYITRKKMSSYNGFSKEILSGEKSLHNIEDDYGVSYYLRGDADNNYVEFGKYSKTQVRGYGNQWYTSDFYEIHSSLDECNADEDYNKNCSVDYEAGEPIYWRIIRVNGDGTIRLIYDGPEAFANSTLHSSSIANSPYSTVSNVGYTYESDDGTQIDSTIKDVVDAWYETNLKTNYEKYLADSIFCNDTSIYSTNSTANVFNGGKRKDKLSPSLICSQKKDRFTINEIDGNGFLSNPIGLISSDEYLLTGGGLTNIQFFLRNSDELIWTMTPTSSAGQIVYFSKNSVASQGASSNSLNSIPNTARPVINLKADVEFTGKGTIDSPYVITTN